MNKLQQVMDALPVLYSDESIHPDMQYPQDHVDLGLSFLLL